MVNIKYGSYEPAQVFRVSDVDALPGWVEGCILGLSGADLSPEMSL